MHCFRCKNVFRRAKGNHNRRLDLADQIPAAVSTQIASPTRPSLVEHEDASISEATQIASPARPRLVEHEKANQTASSTRGLEVPAEYFSDTQLVASSSSSSSTSSSSSASKFKSYDVFLSFRGVDTRNNFTDHLYHALDKMRLDTFRDTERLEKGEAIAPSLLRAIEESKFAVVVFSKDYASSKWCLDELAHIAKCKKESGLEVFPVFYHVEASEVRWQQKGKFREAFEKHEQRYRDNMEMVTNWRIALREIAALSGWDVQNRGESELIRDIAETLSDKIYNTLPSAYRNLVGMDRRIGKLESYLDLMSNNVLTIGIWGMGGIGKTTLAEVVFHKIRNQFDISGFVPNVRSESKEANGLVNLQKGLCQSFCKYQNMNIVTVGMGVEMLKRVLWKQKVLIILDDVDEVKQIEILAAGRNYCWGPGSRLIITTRDRRTLENCDRDKVYAVEILSDEEASQLLCEQAFKQNHAPGDFVELSNKLVRYTKGLPLALEVLGSYLSRKKKLDEWKDAFHRLYVDPDKSIFNVLRISYDGLRDTEKKIFLDTACFFKGGDYVRVKRIWECFGFYPRLGIDDLIDKALIRIERKTLWMHDLLQQMGWIIVLQESLYEPGKRSRLWLNYPALWDRSDVRVMRSMWLYKDARSVLRENKGTSAVEGIFLSLPESEEMWLSNGDPFLNMSNLRLLNIRNVKFWDVHFGYLSNQLRLLEWHECPLESLPPSFEPDQLVEFKIPNSCIKQLWNERLSLEMLLLLDVSNCRYLTKTPNFSTVPHLEKLILEGCETLSEVHPTIGGLQHLVLLNLKGCIRLKSLPHSISLRSLQTFTLSGCSKLEMFPKILGSMETLSELYLDGTAICELPTSIQNLSGLILLNLRGCRNLLGLPRGIFSSLTSLKFLYLSLCSSVDELPENIDRLEHLEELDACHTAIRKVPQSISLLKNLKLLCFHGCKGASTVERSESIGLQLPSSFSGLSCLASLNLGRCDLVEGSISDDIGSLSSLQSLDLSENNIVSIPESISQLSELAELSLFRCSKLRSLPKKLPSSLKVDKRDCPMLPNSSNDLNTWASCTGLSITNCRKAEEDELLTRLPHLNKYCLQYLERLNLSNCQCLTNIPDFSLVPNLKELILQGCPNLSVVHPTIGGLQHLVSLNLKGCVSLESLPQHIRLKSLRTLILSGCSNLHVFPEIEGDMVSLSQLHLDGTALRDLPISMQHLKGLTLLNLRGCKNLLTIPDVVLRSFEFLKYLYMSGCLLIDQLLPTICSLRQLVVLDASESAIRKVPQSIGLLENLRVLSLNGCGLAQGAIPCEIGKLSNLERLDLSENNFLSLPDIFSQLSWLRELRLSRCTQLQSLPKRLPWNLKHVHARDCPMLKSYANNLTIWGSGFRFLYLGKSNEEEDQRSHLPLPVPDLGDDFHNINQPTPVRVRQPIHFQVPLPKDEPIELLIPKSTGDWIDHREPFEIRFSFRKTIPNWWSVWNNSGSSAKIQLSDNSRTWIGFSILVVYKILKSENAGKKWEEEKILCHFQSDVDCLENPLVLQNFSEFKVGFSYGLCFYEPRGGQFGGMLNKSNLQISISTSSPYLMVRGCGIHLISSQQDAPQLVQNLTKYLTEQLDLNFYQPCEKILNEAMKLEGSGDVMELGYDLQEIGSTSTVTEGSCGKSNSNIQPRGELQLLLSRLYKGHNGCEKSFHLCFPAPVITMSPSWFFHHYAGDVTFCYVPENLFDDQTWVGLELYVVFTWKTTVSSDDPLSFFLHVDLCAYDHESIIIQRSLKIHSCLVTSDQLVVLHVPRVQFPRRLNQCQSVRALFRTGIPGMAVHVCGSRLVFQHHLEDLIHSLIEGTLGEPHVSTELDYQEHIYVKNIVENPLHEARAIECDSMENPLHEVETLECAEQHNAVEGQLPIDCKSSLQRTIRRVEVQEQVPTSSILRLQKYGSYLHPKQGILVHSNYYQYHLLEHKHCMIVAQEDPKSTLACPHLHIMAETQLDGRYSSAQWKRYLEMLLQYSKVATLSVTPRILNN